MTQKPPKFEDNLAKLEEIIETLEAGEMPLDKALEAFEKGAKIHAQCQKTLDEAELRVEKIITGKNGIKTEPMVNK